MQQGQFGRRGAVLNGAPLQDSASTARPPRPAPERPSYVDPDGTYNGWRWVVVALVVMLVVLAWLEAMFSGTSLITPLNETVLWTMRGIGAVVGLGVGLLLFARVRDQSSTAKALVTVLFTPLMFAFLFNEIAWRVADWSEFGFSQQAFEPARYPIDHISPGRKGRRDVVAIDPFNVGEDTEIPVSDAQYDELRETSAASCITVMQRRSPSGAIEILNDGEYTLREPAPVEVSPCIGSAPGVAPSASSGSANPWSKGS